ncbi:MAG: glycosyltransferase family 4 protein [Pseudomonadota bacterium]
MQNIIIIGAFPEDISLIKGGVQASVYGLAVSLRQRNDIENIEVISLPCKASDKKSHERIVGDIKVNYLETSLFLALGILHLPKILSLIAKYKSPIIHIHGTGFLQLALLGVLRLQKAKIVWTLHGITAKETLQIYRKNPTFTNITRHIFYKYIERFSISIAGNIIVDTPYVAEEINAKKPLHVIPQGIFLQEFAEIQDLQRQLPIILSLGVISPRKGHHLAMQAFAKVRRQNPSAKLVIAGALANSKYFEQLQDLSRELKLGDAVEFRVNASRSEIINLLGAAKIFALMSEEESQGIALCEALAAGIPIVASNVGGIKSVVSPNKNGLLVNYPDIDKFTESINLLLSNNDLYEKFAQEAKNSSKRFDWQNICEQIISIYAKL